MSDFLPKIEVAKLQFFDSKVMDKVSKAVRQRLSRYGAYVRRDARTLLRRKGSKRQPNSRPGQPLFSHTGMLRKWILFFYDPHEQSVTIGPVKLNQVSFNGHGEPVTGTVPEVLEYGGSINVFEALYRVPREGQRRRNRRGNYEAGATQWIDQWMRVDLRSRRRVNGRKTRMRTARIAARPYMFPAAQKNEANLRDWKDSI